MTGCLIVTDINHIRFNERYNFAVSSASIGDKGGKTENLNILN